MDARMQQQGASQYGVEPEMASYTRTGSQAHALDQVQQQLLQQKSGDAAAAFAEAASPISSRPPAGANFAELLPSAVGFPDDEVFVGEDVERGVNPGNRWPRQETQALLKIRSEMDAAFKEASHKGLLWEEVSRKLAESGYRRSAKKCKEKFENVQKYYKRTKEGRAGRQDGKSYKFFNELEALHSRSGGANTTSTTVAATLAVPISVAMVGSNQMVLSSSRQIQPTPISVHVVATSNRPNSAPGITPAGVSGSGAPAGVGFTSNTSSSSEDEEEDQMEEGLNVDSQKRKRTDLSGCGGSTKKMMAFFERLMKDVVERQEEMLQRFLETIEKREQERMIKEETWRQQETARLTREQEMMAQERAISTSRYAAMMDFLQKFIGQTIQIVTIPAAAPPPQQNPPPPQSNPSPPPQPQLQPQPQQQQQYQNQAQTTEIVQPQQQSTELILVQKEQLETTGGSFESPSSRWPKSEVLALIKLRVALELKYREAGPKGPLWEEISKGMQQLGYHRSAKRCKEKWENINKYYKKVKESKKQRREDAKTCPYFHQLDAIYRKKLLRTDASGGPQNRQEPEMHLSSSSNPHESGDVLTVLPSPQSQTTTEMKASSSTNKNGGTTDVGIPLQIPTGNGGLPPSISEEGTVKKPEDIVKDLMAGADQHHHGQAATDNYDKVEDSEYLDEDDDDDEDEDSENEEDKKMAYQIQYQRPNSGPSNSQENQSNSFMAMAQ